MVATRRSTILGPDGVAIETPLLSGETAKPEMFGQRALVYYTEATGLNPPRLAEIMISANHGLARPYLTLAIDMEERYLHYASQLQTRRLALDGVSLTVCAPKGANAKIVDYVNSLADAAMFRDMIQDMLDGIGKGYSVVEPKWEYEAGALRPVLYQHRDPRYFRYDIVGLRDLCLLNEAGLPGDLIQPPYFIKHEPKIRAGIPLRAGLARSAAWAFMVQSFTLQDWSAFAEIYGIPFRVGKYHPSATNADKMALLSAVREIANDAAGIIPAGMEIEFHEVKGNQGHAVFGELMNYLDRKISMVVVGQTMTAEDGSSRAQATVHNEVRHDILRADARQATATLNRDLVRFAVAMNFGPQEVYPQLVLEVAEPEDVTALSGALSVAVPLGLKVGQKVIRKKLGLPDPEEGEDLLEPPKPVPAKVLHPPQPLVPPEQMAALHVRGCRCGCGASRQARFAADDPNGVTDIEDTDDLVDDALEDWREITDPLLAQLLRLADGAASLEEVLARAQTAGLDIGPLVEKLAKATAISRGLGDVRD